MIDFTLTDEQKQLQQLASGCMGIYTVLMASELGITPILVGCTPSAPSASRTAATPA